MQTIHFSVHRRGGIAATFELLRDGHTSRQLTRAVRSGEVIRVRQGHYACPELPAPQVQAYRVGGRLTGMAGARAHGMWVPTSARSLDVQVRPDARSLRTRDDSHERLSAHPDEFTAVTWTDLRRPGTRSLAGPLDCIAVILSTSSARTSFAVVESALHERVISRAEWRRTLRGLPGALGSKLEPASAASESGGESLLQFDLLQQGIRARQQVKIPGVGRVDKLLGERLIVEVDGYEFHSTRDDFEEDRRRDAVAATLGFRTLRFSHTQVERAAPVVLAAIRAALARGDHE